MTGETKSIETEAAVTRDRIGDTIDELRARLSPEALVDHAIESMSTAGMKAITSVRTAASGHPLVIGAAGLAIGIGLLARSRVARPTIEYDDRSAAAANYKERYAANLADYEPQAGAAHKQLDAIQHPAHAEVDGSPLAVLVVGLATGALLGSVMPASAAEMSLFGEMRVRIAAAGDVAVDAAKDELHFSKLSLSGGIDGITKRLTPSLVKILHRAGASLVRPVGTSSGA